MNLANIHDDYNTLRIGNKDIDVEMDSTLDINVVRVSSGAYLYWIDNIYEEYGAYYLNFAASSYIYGSWLPTLSSDKLSVSLAKATFTK